MGGSHASDLPAPRRVTLADPMLPRTSTFFWEADGGLSTVKAVADELERLVPWEPCRKEIEIEQYRRLVRQYRPARAE